MGKIKTYDDVDGFIDYASTEEWENYIKSTIIPLWKVSYIIEEYFDELEREFDNLPWNEVKDEDRPLLLGGVRPSGKEMYANNSLANFYRKFFGLRLKDLQSWVFQQRHGETLTEIVVEVVETDFIRFVKDVFNLLDDALQCQSLVSDFEEPRFNHEELKRNPERSWN